MNATTPTSGAADLPEALRHAADVEHWARGDNGLRGTELRAAAATIRRLHALTAQAISAEPAGAGYAALPDAKTLGEAVTAWIGVETRGAHNWVDTTADRLGFAVRSVVGDMLRASHGQALVGATKQCPGIPRPGCNYLAECGRVCNKCGEVHSAHRLSAAPSAPQAADTGAAAPLLDYAMQIAHERELRVTGNPHDEDGAKLRFEAAAMRHIATGAAQGAVAHDWWRKRADEIELQVAVTGSKEAMRCYTDMRTLLQSATAAPQPAPPADSVLEDAARDHIRALIAQHADILEQNESAYFELCYHRATGWMAWITDKPLCMPPVINPGRTVLAQGQGDTPDEACADAARKQGGAT